ncbi:MAG: helix-turn-helix domain-containing protein [Bacteroidales bacterium]|nr:helix-turn-helix domain-containing protein [Bacteroidales bacterium]
MPSRKPRVQQADIVQRFSRALRDRRLANGMTQVELARQSHVTTSYITRLERATSAPGIDLVDRLATALGCTVSDLLPTTDPPDQAVVLREQVRRLSVELAESTDLAKLSLAAQVLGLLAASGR